MVEHNVPGLREQIHLLAQGIEVPRTSEGLRKLVYLLNYRANPGEHPPSVLYHDAQVDTFVQETLSREDETVQEQASRLANSHDLGRVVDHGIHHTVAGATILKWFGFDESLSNFALAHHHWGLGIPGLANDGFPSRVAEAFKRDKMDMIFREVVDTMGIETLVVLLGDNSKRRTSSNPIVTEISTFDESLADELIQFQITDGKYTEGSVMHQKEILGSRFLLAMIPHIERHLGIRYAPDGSGYDVISRARARWPEEKEKVDRMWERLHQTGGAVVEMQ